MLSVLFWLVFGVIGLVGIGLAYLTLAPPTGFIRDQLISRVKEQTGRDLKISGNPQITFYPAVGLSLDRVRLGPPPGMSGPDTLRAKTVTIAVKLLPLLSRKVEVSRFIVTDPVIDLRKSADGLTSWTFAGLGTPATDRPIRYARGPEAQVSGAHLSGSRFDVAELPPEARAFRDNATGHRSGGETAAALKDLKLGDARIVNGRINYTDETTGTRETVNRVNVNLSLDRIDKPLRSDGEAQWNGKVIRYEGRVTTLEKILQNKPARVVATLASDHFSAGYDGSLVAGDAVSAKGVVSVESPSLRAFAAWLGSALPAAPGYGPMKLNGRLTHAGSETRLSQMTAELDGAKATGDISVVTGAARPMVTADLDLSALDLNKYLPAEGTETSPGGDARSRTRVKAAELRHGWSTEPIDFAGLKAVDADAKLNVGTLKFKDLKADRARINAKLRSGRLDANLADMQLYQGAGQGVVTLAAARNAGGSLTARFNIRDVAAQPLLRDAIKLDRVTGKGNLTLAVSTQGASEFDLVSALGGTANFRFFDGALEGVNIAKYVRALRSGQLNALSSSAASKTDFSELSASLKIANGIATNDDLKLLSPLIRVGGTGKVMLPTRQVDYTVRPKLVSSLSGQGGDTGLSGLEIPVRIHGSLDDPQYTPDLEGILKDPNKAIDAVKQIGETFKGKSAGEIVDGLFGGGSGDGDGSDKKIDGKALLKGLFGR